MSKEMYLIIENAEVYSSTSNGNLFTTGFPALTNFLGFSEYIKFILNEDQMDLVNNCSISIVVNDMDYQKSHNKFMLYKKNDSVKDGNTNASTVDEKKVFLNLNLYLKINLDKDNYVNDSEIDTIKYIQQKINEKQFNFKIAGGKIFNSVIFLTKDNEDIIKSLSKKRHSFLLEKSELDINEMSNKEIVSTLNEKTNNRKQLFLQVGYSILEDFKEINLSRNGAENALAIPILNFIQARKVYSYLYNDNYKDVENYFEQKIEDNKILFSTKTL